MNVIEHGMGRSIKNCSMILLILGISYCAGCASMFAPGPDEIIIDSHPQEASVKLDGVFIGKTPIKAIFTRSCEGHLTFEKNGYNNLELDIDKVLNGPFLLNLPWFIGIIGPIGVVVDLVNHNQGKYPTDSIIVELEKSSQ